MRTAGVAFALLVGACGSAAVIEPVPSGRPFAVASGSAYGATSVGEAPSVRVGHQSPPMGTLEEGRLVNGVRLTVLRRADLPLESFAIVIDRSAVTARTGTVRLFADLLLSGTERNVAADITYALRSAGAAASVTLDGESIRVEASALSLLAPSALRVLARSIRGASFPDDELKTQRNRLLAAASGTAKPDVIAEDVVHGLLGLGANDKNLSTERDVIAAATRDELRSLHRELVTSDRVSVVATGPMTLQQVGDAIDALTALKPGAARSATANVEATAPATARTIVIDRPGSAHATIYAGFFGVPAQHPDYPALRIAGADVRGTMQHRLVFESAVAYETDIDRDLRSGPLPVVIRMSVETRSVGQTLKTLWKVLARTRSRTPSARWLADEIDDDALFEPARIETNRGATELLARYSALRLSIAQVNERAKALRAVQPGDVPRVAASYLDPARMQLVIVGDATRIATGIEAAGLPAPEIRR